MKRRPEEQRGPGRAPTISRVRAYCLEGGRGGNSTIRGHTTRTKKAIHTRIEVDRKVVAPKKLGIDARTRIVKNSNWEYWKGFSKVWGVDIAKFGSLGANTEESMSRRLKDELDTITAFAAFVVFTPRAAEGCRVMNSVYYAEQIISSVRGHYVGMHGRRPGLSNGELGGKQLRYNLNGLRKLAPKHIRIKRPMLQTEIRRIRAVMDLEGYYKYRTMWALWMMQWKGVMRCGDLIKRRSQKKGPWEASKDTHRGRFRVEIMREAGGEKEGVKLVMRMKPTKTDPAGERGFKKSFVIERWTEALSAGEALWQMLRKYRETGRKEDTTLFRNEGTGLEVTYEDSRAWLKRMMGRANINEDGLSPHSLRVGGATAYEKYPDGGELVAGSMGLWRSSAGDAYIHAGKRRLERAGVAIGREIEDECEHIPGPVSSYAGIRRRRSNPEESR